MSDVREELLQPSLSGTERPAAAPYSVRTTFLAGFFGGPIGATAILIANSVRLRRLERDLPPLLVALAAALAGGWALYNTAAGADVRAWLESELGNSGVRLAFRAAALAIVGLGYLLQRQEQRSTDLAGLTRPNGLLPGIGCIVLGVVLQIAFVAAVVR